jgi:DNA-directed RNA polymerase specialized sigma24 family protein
MTPLQHQLRLVIADRTSPEARALLQTLARYAHGRVSFHLRTNGGDAFGPTDAEDVVGEVLLELATGALARFRGGSLPELLAYVRTMTDRTVWRLVRRRRSERALLDGPAEEEVRSWTAPAPGPDVEGGPRPTALPADDAEYLTALLEAGNKADFARHAGVSRAAVTQRVNRIKSRISALSAGERDAVDAWLHTEAVRALRRGA